MKTLQILAASLALSVVTPAFAADTAVEAPIRAMEAAFNKGATKAAKATHVAAPTIIDEVAAPFTWSGPAAFDGWIGTMTKSEAARGRTDGTVALGAATRTTVSGDTAYVITPSTYTFKQKGQLMRETGTITFALVKQPAGWKIRGWTWTSPEAAPVAQ